MKYWIVKQEPSSYGFAQFLREGKTNWTGVRNFQARNFLRQMEKGDPVFYYHTGDEKQIVGMAEVTKPAFPDPTAEEGDWVCVELTAKKTLSRPVSLAEIKTKAGLKNLLLIKQSRLSVVPVTNAEAQELIQLSRTGSEA